MRDLTVIVPTFNRSAQIDRLMNWLSTQTIDRKQSELIVVNDGSSDDTEAVLKRWQEKLGGWLRPLSQANQGQSKARAYGVEQSEGRFLLFLDDDMEPTDPDFFQKHLNFHLGLKNESVILGAILKPRNNPQRPAFEYFYERSIDRMYQNFAEGIWKPAGQHFFSANVSMPRSLYLRSGGFDPNYRHAEDRELGLRLQHSFKADFCFAGQAAAYHHSPTGLYESFCRRARLYGHYDWLISRVYPSIADLNPSLMLDAKHPGKRVLARLSYRYPKIADLANRVLIPTCKGLHKIGLTRIAVAFCSVLFCCNYMHGLKEIHTKGDRA